jgi:hypothetical protein
MAISGRFEYRGVVAENAYLRIEEVEGGKKNGWRGMVKVYYNQDCANHSLNVITMFPIFAPYESEVFPYQPLYDELKTVPQFSAFQDV